MIRIKDTQVFRALLLKTYDPMLVEIIASIEGQFPGICITEGWRYGVGVHSIEPCRGIDLRSRDYSKRTLEALVNYINDNWIYDSERLDMKCVLVHDVGRGIHLHIQVHPNTRRKEI